MFGIVTSYVRMAWKVANYNSLRDEISTLRGRYARLERESSRTKGQLAELQLYASEVSMAFGLKRAIDGSPDLAREGKLLPTITESVSEYNALRNANFSTFRRSYVRRWRTNTTPSLWPVNGRLLSHWGYRDDPFRGEDAFHSGVDISAVTGTPVRVTADGLVAFAGYSGAYGKLVVIDHGDGLETYYAHLSRFDVIEGQEVRRGDIIAASGGTGRVTSPHLHYEVRDHGRTKNPYPYLARSAFAQTPRRDFPF
ncbi:MAG: M23 family metallopeptidase [Bryobacteraceae bacterium]